MSGEAATSPLISSCMTTDMKASDLSLPMRQSAPPPTRDKCQHLTTHDICRAPAIGHWGVTVRYVTDHAKQQR